jgi:hypothetical protein
MAAVDTAKEVLKYAKSNFQKQKASFSCLLACHSFYL